MNWLITGGAGFIGRNLIGRLVREGEHGIRVVDDLSVGSLDALKAVASVRTLEPSDVADAPAGVELVRADVRDGDAALAAARGIDAIVHLAANTGVQPSIADPMLDATTNVLGTLHYLEAARRNEVDRFVFASSGGTVIGDVEPPIHEEMVPHPKAPYGASKSAGEGYLSAYHGTFGIQATGLRFANVYGPGSTHKNSVVAKFIRRALAGEPLEIYGDGAQTRDFVYVDDLVDAVVRAATRPNVGGEVFQIATARETSVGEIAEALVPILASFGVDDVTVAHGDPLPGEIRRNFSDTRKAQDLLGWNANVALDEGLKRTVAWFVRG